MPFLVAIAMALLIFLQSPQELPAASILMVQAQKTFDAIPDTPPNHPENPLTPAKVSLGKKLFFDPRLSASQMISCNTCHNLSLGGVDHQATSLGHGWYTGPRNAPTVLNSIFNIAAFWDGRARNLFEQAASPLENPIEMASSDPAICNILISIPEYGHLFEEAFPDSREPICFTNIRKAIAAFEITLLTPNAPFDLFLKGSEDAIGSEAKRGLALFMDKGCAKCHMSMNLGGNGYYEFGVENKPDQKYLPPDDIGRSAILKTIEKKYVFKVPSLRNVALTAPYFHSGSAWTLEEAVEVMVQSQLGITLPPSDRQAIEAFLESLTGKQPEIDYPLLPRATEETPRPVH